MSEAIVNSDELIGLDGKKPRDNVSEIQRATGDESDAN